MVNKMMLHTNSHRVKHIMQQDERFRALITYMGDLEIPLRNNFYASLIKSINGQLLSVKVAEIIHARLEKQLHYNINPLSITRLADDDLRKIGISAKKISYIRELTDRVLQRDIVLEELYDLEDQDIIRTLTSIKGIGQWTAEMFLIFSLGREDVLALKDVGLHRGAKWLYQLDNNQEGMEMLQRKSLDWKPHRTVASHYLWEIVKRDYLIHYDHVYELIAD